MRRPKAAGQGLPACIAASNCGKWASSNADTEIRDNLSLSWVMGPSPRGGVGYWTKSTVSGLAVGY
jgi:hypothetical protein